MPEWDVCVVGAGPVGLTAAALLTARGARVLVVERAPTTSNAPKAISLDDESLRTYQQAGLVDEVLRVIMPGTGTAYYDSHGELLFHGRAAVPQRLGYPFKNPFAQPDLERVLVGAMRRRSNATVRFAAELIGFHQHPDAVHLDLAGPDGPEGARVSFLIGADGGRSTVRTLLDVPMAGRSYPDRWLVVDTHGDSRRERYGMHHGDPRRPHVVVPGFDGRCRYEFLVRPDECDDGDDPPFSLIERLLAPFRSITPDEVERAVVYRFHALSATRWRDGRVFLVGDAAHMMPPFAGQGLNSGIRDAANLAWKLDAALAGLGGDALLDSYQLERKPHADAVIRSSERLGRVVMTTNARLAAFRDTAVRRALATPGGRAYFEEMRYRPAARFDDGLVLDPGTHPLIGTQVGQPLVFDLENREMVLLDRVLGDGWALLGVDVGDRWWTPARGAAARVVPVAISIPLDESMADARNGVRVVIDLDGALTREVGDARGCFVLVRPDRVVAAVIRPDALAHLRTEVARWFARAEVLATK